MFKKISLLCLCLGFGWIVTSNPSNTEFSIDQLLVQMGVGFYTPTTLELAKKTNAMVDDIQNYCDALNLNPQSAEFELQKNNSKEQAQKSWTETMKAYHQMDAAPFGPLYENKRELADNIYSWPLMNECGFHMEMMSIKENNKFSDKVLFTSKGLMGTEFGLFKDLDSTTCNTKNKSFAKVHSWLKNSELEKEKDMCAFALASAKDLQQYTQKLANDWQADLGNYTSKMVANPQDLKGVLNVITDGLFATIEIAKDIQLGIPSGLNSGCTKAEGKCPTDVEHKWSALGFDALEAQFLGLNQILEDGGLGQYLKAEGFETIYNNIANQNNEILNHIQNLKLAGSLNQQMLDLDPKLCKQTTDSNNLVPVCGLQRQIRTLVQLLRSEFFPALRLTAPAVHQGDAD
jgi:uncharacterized protein